MRKLILLILLSSAFAQTPVDSILTLKNSSPPAIGSTLTPAIMNSGSIGLASWSTGSGTPSVMTVGSHLPECALPFSASVGGVQYQPALLSQSIAYNNNTNFTWIDSDAPASQGKYSWGVCLKLGAINIATNLYDLIRTDGQLGAAATFQLQNKTCLNFEINAPSTQHSPCITVTNSAQALWCSGFVDSVNGLAKAACFIPTYPYTQVGSTVQISFTGRGNVSTTRVGNVEVGTAAGTTNFFENMVFDYTNATFPIMPNYATPWAGIIAPVRAMNWAGAGVIGGIPARTTICSTLNPGATTTQINNALSSCPNEQTVFLNAGTYNGLGMLTIPSHKTLRGAGGDQTHLVFTSAAGCTGQLTLICFAGDNTDKVNPRNLTNWTSGYQPGSKVITLAGPLTNLVVGKSIILDQADDTTDLGGIVVSDTSSSITATSPGVAGPRSLEGNGGGSQRSGRQQQQEVVVLGCNNDFKPGDPCTGSNVSIVLADSIYMPNWDASKSPQAWWATTQHEGGGIENFSIDGGSIANSAIVVKWLNTKNTYIKGVRSIEAYRAHLQMQFASHGQIQDSYFFYTNDGGTSITHYGVECYGATDVLIVNNVFQGVPGPLPLNSACEGNAILYNSFVNMYFSQSSGWNNPWGNNHTAGTEMNLIEGNVGNTWDGDVFHGTHHFNTMFRNYFSGTQPVCYASGSTFFTATYGACNNNRIGIQLRSWSRFFNIVGNVIGTSGINTTYTSTAGDRTIFTLNDGNSNGTVTVPDDPNVTTTLLRWGNWDVVNNATRFQSSEVPASLSANSQSPFANFQPTVGNSGQPALPASFYYSVKPSWWPAAKVWPPIGPDVTGGNISGTSGHANTNPAQDCFIAMMNASGQSLNGTGITPGTFNANTCYGSGAPPVQPPSAPACGLFAKQGWVAWKLLGGK